MPERSTAAENILVRGVNWLGDAVMTTPALWRLRQAKPTARITILAPAKLAGLWEKQHCLDELMTFQPQDGLWKTARRLAEKKFTLGLAFPNSIRSAVELWLAGIPRRVGAERPFGSIILTLSVTPAADARPMRKRTLPEIQQLLRDPQPASEYPASSHHVHQYLRLVAALGASSEPLPPRLDFSDEEAAQTALRLGLKPEDGPWFGLNAGAEYGPAKRWPAEKFAAVANTLGRERPCRWVIFGGETDTELATNLAAQIDSPVLNLAGKTSLRELMAALKTCKLLLTNDSGPMHLASALGTPVVALFGSTAPELTGPLFAANAQIVRQAGVPCAPCFLRQCPIDFRCMNEIQPEAVIEATQKVL